jgi:hypothetical protein
MLLLLYIYMFNIIFTFLIKRRHAIETVIIYSTPHKNINKIIYGKLTAMNCLSASVCECHCCRPPLLSIHFIWFRLKGRLFKASHLEQRGVCCVRAMPLLSLLFGSAIPVLPHTSSSSFSGHDDSNLPRATRTLKAALKIRQKTTT